MALLLAGILLSNPSAVPTVTLNNGVDMPVAALGTAGYDNATAEAAVNLAMSLNLTHVHTAYDYFNQAGVGKALAGRPRDSFFLTTMTSPCIHSASNPYAHTQPANACDLWAHFERLPVIRLQQAERHRSGGVQGAYGR